MYMVKGTRKLRWRRTRMRDHRLFNDLTLEAVVEILANPPYGIEYTHNSLGRVEHGMQMPSAGLLEALAKIYKTDVDSLLNRLPTLPKGPTADAAELARIWEASDAETRRKLVTIAKTMAGTG